MMNFNVQLPISDRVPKCNDQYALFLKKLQILLIWLLSCQGISGQNWLKCCIISQTPNLLKILDSCTTQETNFTDAV